MIPGSIIRKSSARLRPSFRRSGTNLSGAPEESLAVQPERAVPIRVDAVAPVALDACVVFGGEPVARAKLRNRPGGDGPQKKRDFVFPPRSPLIGEGRKP